MTTVIDMVIARGTRALHVIMRAEQTGRAPCMKMLYGIGTMFGVSFPELIVVFVVALIIFGPDKLPEFARTVGKFTAQFRRQSDSLRREFYNTVYRPADELKGSITREARSLMSEPVPPAEKPKGTSPEPAAAPNESEKI